MRTNGWITLENTRALAWWDWLQWYQGDQTDPEPELTNWEKNAIKKLVDIEYAFRAYKKATIQLREWRLLSVWDVTVQQLNAGYAVLGDAEEGGDYGVAGYWEWEAGDAESQWMPEFDWRPNTVIRYMPDECVDPPECTETQPATEVWDVNLLAGQPPRILPEDPIIITEVADALIASLEEEGWGGALIQHALGKRMNITYNGSSYAPFLRNIFHCDFGDLPGPLAADLEDALQAQGYCID